MANHGHEREGASIVRRVLHLSDTHLTATGFDEDGVDARSSLRLLLADVRRVSPIDLVVVSGDITDDGSLGGYADARDQILNFAANHGAPTVLATGNHDDRINFGAVLGSGHRAPDGSDCGVLMSEYATARAALSDAAGLRVITLDSLVPGKVHGHVNADQLDWLQTVLATRAPAGSLVILHHPPISVPGHPMTDVVLDNADSLAAVLDGSDVRAVLCGHLHHQMSGLLAGVPVWVTPGVVTRIDTTSPSRLVRGVLGAGATIIDLADGPPIFRVIQARDPRAGEQVYLYDMASGADRMTE